MVLESFNDLQRVDKLLVSLDEPDFAHVYGHIVSIFLPVHVGDVPQLDTASRVSSQHASAFGVNGDLGQSITFSMVDLHVAKDVLLRLKVYQVPKPEGLVCSSRYKDLPFLHDK